MMDLVMNFDTDECLVTAMFDKGNRNDTMEAIDNIIPFLKGDADTDSYTHLDVYKRQVHQPDHDQ